MYASGIECGVSRASNAYFPFFPPVYTVVTELTCPSFPGSPSSLIGSGVFATAEREF